MKKVSIYFLLLAITFQYGCNKESINSTLDPTTPQEAQYYLDKAESLLELDKIEIAFQAKIDREDEDVNVLKSGQRIVRVPADSHNALQAAVDRVRTGGTVILETGEHLEDNTVHITKRIKIKGETGAVLRFDTEPDLDGVTPNVIDPGLFVEDANGVIIEGISFKGTSDLVGTAILFYNANFARVRNNSIEDHMLGVVQNYADFNRIHDNEMVSARSWSILNVNGRNSRIYDNNTGSFFVGDRGGLLFRNEFNGTGEVIGILFCTPRLPPAFIQLPDGTLANADESANEWLAVRNTAQNYFWAYLAIDGANNNYLVNNQATGSVLADIELAGDSERFGFFTPTSLNNLVISTAYPETTIKVCGENNRAIGGTQIDTNESPCD